MLEPVGPLPPSVYRRRRAVALGVVVLLFGLLTWGIAATLGGAGDAAPPVAEAPGEATPRPAAFAAAEQAERARQAEERAEARPGGGTPTSRAPAAPAPSSPAPPRGEAAVVLPAPPGVIGRGLLPGAVLGPLPSTAARPTAPPSTTPESRQAPAAAPKSAPHAADPGAAGARTGQSPPRCTDDALSVLARTDRSRYASGEKPVLSLVVRNTGKTPCVRDLDAARQAVAVVRKPGDGVWSSNDCAPGDTDDVRVLGPGQEAVFSVRWSGRTSRPGCPAAREVVPAGRYELLARLDDTVSAPVAFNLDD